MTELGLDFVAKQVDADKDDRKRMEAATGCREIPTLLTERREVFSGEDEILAYLDRYFDECPDAGVHRAKARQEVRQFAELAD